VKEKKLVSYQRPRCMIGHSRVPSIAASILGGCVACFTEARGEGRDLSLCFLLRYNDIPSHPATYQTNHTTRPSTRREQTIPILAMSKRFLKKTATGIAYHSDSRKSAKFWRYAITVFFKTALTLRVLVQYLVLEYSSLSQHN